MQRVLALTIVVLCATPAISEPLPQPRTDFEASSKGPAGTTFVYRHHEGKLRVDMKVPSAQMAATSLVDISGRKVVAMIGPATSGVAVELDLNEAEFGLLPGLLDAKRVGAATVAGEPCNLWEVTHPPSRSANRRLSPSSNRSPCSSWGKRTCGPRWCCSSMCSARLCRSMFRSCCGR